MNTLISRYFTSLTYHLPGNPNLFSNTTCMHGVAGGGDKYNGERRTCSSGDKKLDSSPEDPKDPCFTSVSFSFVLVFNCIFKNKVNNKDSCERNNACVYDSECATQTAVNFDLLPCRLVITALPGCFVSLFPSPTLSHETQYVPKLSLIPNQNSPDA